jgi:U3 small nucleolar RNA-associated protein 11
MSSLRNAVKRVTHKERAQPQSRAHLGILEKKKDYRGRAQDYHRKEARIKAIQEKVAMRNPDEFYFGMKNAQVLDGKHRKTLEAKQKEFEADVGLDTVRIMKTQDLGYVRMQKQRDAKKVERLQSSLHFLADNSESKKRKHTIFVESRQVAENFNVAEHFDTLPELAGRTVNRPRKQTVQEIALIASGSGSEVGEGNTQIYQPTRQDLEKEAKRARKVARKLARISGAGYKEMEERKERVQKLERAEAHLVTEKLVQGKGRKRKIKAAENGQPAQYKWRRKRQG